MGTHNPTTSDYVKLGFLMEKLRAEAPKFVSQEEVDQFDDWITNFIPQHLKNHPADLLLPTTKEELDTLFSAFLCGWAAKQPGPTGEPSVENAPPGDAGGLKAALLVHKPTNSLVMNFGTPLSYIMMTKQEALLWAAALVAKAETLE